jgi:hypothetical protein
MKCEARLRPRLFLVGRRRLLQLFAWWRVFEEQPNLLMKTLLTSILSASLLGLAYRFGGRPFDVIDFTAFLFATGLVTWTIEQYSHSPRVLLADRPIRFPSRLEVVRNPHQSRRLAA